MLEIVNVTNTARGGRAEVKVYGEIGWETDANRFVDQLNELDVDEITVRVHSPGGDAYDGIAIMSALKSHPAKVTTVIEGMAASAASFIAVGGADEVVIRPHAEIMIHDAMTVAMGNSEDMQRAIANLDRVSDNIARVYAEKSGGDPEVWRNAMREETWFTADEAELAGLVDRVEDGAVDSSGLLNNFKMVNKFRGRRGNPPVNLLRGKDDGGIGMDDLTKQIANKLGLDEATFTADDVLKMIEDAGKSTGVEVKVEDDQGEDDQGEAELTPEEQAVADAEAALAAARAAAAKAAEEAADNEGGDDPDEDQGSDADLETVVLDKATFEELKAAAEHGWQAKAQNDARAREAEVDQWISEGRLNASRKAEILNQMEKNAAGVRAVIGNIPAGTIPRGESGHGLDMSDSHDGTKGAHLTEAANRTGLFAAPNI